MHRTQRWWKLPCPPRCLPCRIDQGFPAPPPSRQAPWRARLPPFFRTPPLRQKRRPPRRPCGSSQARGGSLLGHQGRHRSRRRRRRRRRRLRPYELRAQTRPTAAPQQRRRSLRIGSRPPPRTPTPPAQLRGAGRPQHDPQCRLHGTRRPEPPQQRLRRPSLKRLREPPRRRHALPRGGQKPTLRPQTCRHLGTLSRRRQLRQRRTVLGRADAQQLLHQC